MNIVPGPHRFVNVVTDLLSHGYRVRFRAEGASMLPTIRGGETITVEPVSEVKMGDIALYRAERGLIAHRVVGIRKGNGEAHAFLARGEARGSGEEAVQEQQVLGKVVAVERNGRSIDLGSRWAKIRCRAGSFARLARHWGATLFSVRRAGVCLLIFALVAIFPNAARANVSIVSTASTSATSGNNWCTLTLNTSSLPTPPTIGGVILVSISGTNANSFGPPTISPAGGTVTLIYSQTTTDAGEIGMWSITTPTPSATTTITLPMSGASGGVCGATAFDGVASVGTVNVATGTSTTPSVTLTNPPGPGGAVFDTMSTVGGSGVTTGATPCAGQVQQWNTVGGGSANRQGAASVAPPTNTMCWTLNQSQTWRIAAVPLNPLEPSEVQPSSFTVTQRAARNQIEDVIVLKTGREVNSLGFNLYREQNGRRVRLNSSLLAGTALLAGADTTLTAGHVHTWWDAPPGGSSSVSYWVEEVDLHGQHTWYGPATPTAAKPGASVNSAAVTKDATGQVVFLSQVGAPGTGVGSTSHPLQAYATPTVTPQSSESQFTLAAGHAVKIGVQSEGWYNVAFPALVAAGLDPNADASTLQLFAEGVEQPILVQGQVGNKLGPQSTIQFYGTGLDTTWSDTRIYWLTWGQATGLRVQTEPPQTGAAGGLSSFPFTVEWKPRTVYFAALLNGDTDNFFGPALTSGQPVSQAITIMHLNPNAAAQLRVALQGVSAGSHSVAVALNGHQLGTVAFSDQKVGVETLAVPQKVLQEGSNLLTLTVEGGAEDVSAVDYVEVLYPHSYTADSDSLSFSALSGEAVTIGGFSNNQILVADITNPGAVTLLPSTIIAQAGSYSISLVPQGGGERKLLALTLAREAQPASITTHHPSSWHTAQAGFDMVMISHANFVPSLTPLVTLHQGQGLQVAVIDVADLYDEFNFGEKSPYALKNFLIAARAHWTLKPHFVMLVGDATFDPRNYLGVGNFDFVPTYLADTALIETASDDWYADFSGNGVPQMAIGRLPVRTAPQAGALVSKIVNYDQSGDAAWKHQVLLVADLNDSQNDFEADAAAAKALLPTDLTVSEIIQGSSAHADLLNDLNVQGEAMVDYIGHGSEEAWTPGGLFDSADASALTNGSMTPFVVSMTCLSGYFQDVYGTALAKALIEAPGGGALAVWTSSGLTDSSTQATLNEALIKALFGAQPMTIGEAAAKAKAAIFELDVRRTWILFGDPATKLQ